MSGALNGRAPQNPEAEEAVLGAILLAGAIPDNAGSLEVAAFYQDSHQRTYAAMRRLHDRGTAIDVETVVAELERARELDRVGGRAAVEMLAGSVPFVGNVGEYARIVTEHAHARRVRELAARLYENPADPESIHALRNVARVDVHGETDAEWLAGTPMDPEGVAAEPLPAIPGFPFLHPAAGAIITGPTGGGRSSLIQACAYDAARAGIRVAYLGSEVTAEEYNARAADLASRRGDRITSDLRARLANARYLDLGSVIARAWENPDRWARAMPQRFDVVALDPLSAVASTLGLDFDSSNREFVEFYTRLIQPLVTAGVAVPMLDNVGHAIEARGRAKGASAKEDVVDLSFSCKLQASPVGLIVKAGKVRSVRAPHRRNDAWVFDRDTQRIHFSANEAGADHNSGADSFRPSVLMERISRAIEDAPGLGKRGVRAVKGKNDALDLGLELLVAEGYVIESHEGQAVKHYSARPYRAETDDRAPTVPPAQSRRPCPRAPPPKRGHGHGHGSSSQRQANRAPRRRGTARPRRPPRAGPHSKRNGDRRMTDTTPLAARNCGCPHPLTDRRDEPERDALMAKRNITSEFWSRDTQRAARPGSEDTRPNWRERGYDKRYDRNHKRVLRDETLCWICGDVVDKTLSGRDPKGPSVDHVIPRAQGGSNDRDNLRLAHLSCNSAHAGRRTTRKRPVTQRHPGLLP